MPALSSRHSPGLSLIAEIGFQDVFFCVLLELVVPILCCCRHTDTFHFLGVTVWDLGHLSTTVALEAANLFGRKVADGAAASLGAKIVDWLKSTLTGAAEKAALQNLSENPDSAGAQRTLEGVILSRLEQDASLARELVSLLGGTDGGTKLTQKVTGDFNQSVQSVGHRNWISQRRV